MVTITEGHAINFMWIAHHRYWVQLFDLLTSWSIHSRCVWEADNQQLMIEIVSCLWQAEFINMVIRTCHQTISHTRRIQPHSLFLFSSKCIVASYLWLCLLSDCFALISSIKILCPFFISPLCACYMPSSSNGILLLILLLKFCLVSHGTHGRGEECV